MAQRVTLLGEVINTTNTPLHMAQLDNVIRRSHKLNRYTFTYGPACNFIRRSHKHKQIHILHMAQRVTLLGEVINTTDITFTYGPAGNFNRRNETQQIHLYIWPSGYLCYEKS